MGIVSAARRAAFISLAGALLLGGCGGSSTVRPATYAKNVCAALGTWKSTVQRAAVALQASDPASTARTTAKSDYERFVDALARTTQRTADDLHGAGIPNEAGGKRMASRLTRAFDSASRHFAQGVDQAKAIRTDSISTFQLTATAVSDQIKAGLETVRTGVLGGPSCPTLQG